MAELLSPDDRNEILRIYGEMKTGYSSLQELITKGEPTGEVRVKLSKIDESLMDFHRKHQDSLAKIEAIETRMTERQKEMADTRSFGERIMDDPGMAAFLRNPKGAYNVETKHWRYDAVQTKDITGISLLVPDLVSTIAQAARLPFGVRQLVPQGRTTAGAVEYLRETAFTNNANVVAEGAPKPKSDKTFDVASSVVRTIAHIFKVSKQSWEDLPGLASLIESNGIYGVQLKEDQQLLNGTGIAPQLQGFMTVATAAPAPTGTGANLIDAIGAAVFDLAAKGFIADGTVVNPANWGAVAMLKNSQGNYLWSNPMSYTAAMNVWGTRLVTSSNMAAGSFLTGQFRGTSQILDREDVNVQVAEQNVDDFERNLLTVRVEERLALLIFNVNAFEKGVVPAGTELFTPTGAAPAPAPESEAPRRRG